MSEVLVKEWELENGGFKVFVDREKKLVKRIGIGRCDAQGFKEVTEATKVGIKKFSKGEPIYPTDDSEVDMRFFTPDMMKLVDDSTAFIISHCRKTASVFPSFVLRKGLEHSATPNYKIFDNVQEALQWLSKA